MKIETTYNPWGRELYATYTKEDGQIERIVWYEVPSRFAIELINIKDSKSKEDYLMNYVKPYYRSKNIDLGTLPNNVFCLLDEKYDRFRGKSLYEILLERKINRRFAIGQAKQNEDRKKRNKITLRSLNIKKEK